MLLDDGQEESHLSHRTCVHRVKEILSIISVNIHINKLSSESQVVFETMNTTEPKYQTCARIISYNL